jgi:hypothetical protein
MYPNVSVHGRTYSFEFVILALTPARLHSDVKPGGQMSSFIMTISRTIFFRLLAHAPEGLQREAKENAL